SPQFPADAGTLPRAPVPAFASGARQIVIGRRRREIAARSPRVLRPCAGRPRARRAPPRTSRTRDAGSFPAESGDVERKEPRSRAASGVRVASRVSEDPCVVVLAEDEEDLRIAIADILEDAGYLVV